MANENAMDSTPQGVANRLRYRLSERYPLGVLEVEPTADGNSIKVVLHGKDGKTHEESFDYATLKRAQDPLNEVLPRLKQPRDLLPKDGTSQAVELGGKVIEVANERVDEDGNAVNTVVVTGDQELAGADSAPDGAVTEGITDSADPAETVAPTPDADTDTTKDLPKEQPEATKDNEPRPRTRAAAKADDKKA